MRVFRLSNLNTNVDSNIFILLLFLYHLIFLLLNSNFVDYNGGDANLYWFQTATTDGYSWSQLFYYGNALMCWFNYPFAVVLNLPIWGGHLLYSFIGFLGILKFFKLARLVIGEQCIVYGYNVLPLIAFMPNVHFWTAGISKEVLCFYAITTILVEVYRSNFKSIAFIAGWALLIGIRPHVALMLLLALGVVYLWCVPLSRKRKLTYTIALITVLIALYLLVCNIIHISPLDIERWLVNNKSWRDSFSDSGSYVVIHPWNIPYQFFSFYFRPFFYDIHHLYSWFLSIENLILLCVYVFGIYRAIVRWSMLRLNSFLWSIVAFNCIGFLIYMQRYAGLGIFIRTKMMFQPFMVIVLLYIIAMTTHPISTHAKTKIS